MLCPECGGEFVEGIDHCPDCDVTLVAASAAVRTAASDEELVAVFETTDVALVPVVKSLLDDAGLPYLLQGEGASGVLALPPILGAVSRSAFGVLVLVPESFAEEAGELLAELESAAPELQDEEKGDRSEPEELEVVEP